MFVTSLRTHASFQAIAMLVATSLLLWAVGAQFLGAKAEAANLTEFSDLITDSATSATANHTIDFIMPNGMTSGENITITFESGFDLSSLAGANDVDVAFDGAATTTAGTAAAGVFGYTGVSGQDITLTSPTDGVASGTRLTVLIGTHTLTGDNQIVNPSATSSYTIDIAGTAPDSGQTQVAIVDTVLVTARVNTVFNFNVYGIDNGVTLPNIATSTGATSTFNSLPFGVLTADQSKVMAQRLNVTTNAANGFVVTVEQSQDLQSSTGAVIDSFTDGTYQNTPTAWQAPGDSIGDDKTWGHWGLSSDDDDFSGTDDLWVAASTTPRLVFAHSSSSDGTTADIGSTTVAYQIEITPLQEAGNDYTTTLTYIATPTF